MNRDNEKLIKDITNRIDGNITKEELEEILCDVIRNYKVDKINYEKYNLEQIMSLYQSDMELQGFTKSTIKK